MSTNENTAQNYSGQPDFNSPNLPHHNNATVNPQTTNSQPSGGYTHSGSNNNHPSSATNPTYSNTNHNEHSNQGYGAAAGPSGYENVNSNAGSTGAYETGGAGFGGDRHAHTATGPVGSSPPNSHVTNTHPSTGSRVKESASGAKGLVAAVHGAGETIRGKFNSAVDETFHEPQGVAKNEAIANQGEREFETGKFSHAAKEREGVVPGNKRAI